MKPWVWGEERKLGGATWEAPLRLKAHRVLRPRQRVCSLETEPWCLPSSRSPQKRSQSWYIVTLRAEFEFEK